MERIASFSVNHDLLEKGMYVSRADGDVTTYDIRMAKPNSGVYLSNAALHSFEHLFATFARNSAMGRDVVYVGPMGCRTGFYLLMRDTGRGSALALTRDCFRMIAEYEGEIPGAARTECGNCLEHDLSGARAIARDMLSVLKDWKASDMTYRE